MATQVKKTNNTGNKTFPKATSIVKVEKEPEIKETQIVDDNKDLEKATLENETLKAKLSQQETDFNSKLVQMQAQMDALLKIVGSGVNSPQTINKDEDIPVGCRVFAGVGMTNAEGTQTVTFKCGEKKFIPYEDLKSFLKENIRNNKALFSNGLLFFYNDEDYGRFKVKKLVDLSEENVLDIINTQDTNQMIGKLNTLTDNLRRDAAFRTFQYIVAEILIREPQKTKGFTYDNRKALEDYIGVKFDTLIANSGMYKFLVCKD